MFVGLRKSGSIVKMTLKIGLVSSVVLISSIALIVVAFLKWADYWLFKVAQMKLCTVLSD